MGGSADRSTVGPAYAAITGLGIISSIGTTLGQVSESLRNGRSGIVVDAQRLKVGFRSGLTGCIPEFAPADFGLSKKMLRTMPEAAQHAYAATHDALADAGLRRDQVAVPRCGLIFGNDSSFGPVVEYTDVFRATGGTHGIGAGALFQCMNSTVTMNLASTLGVGGVSYTVSAACASGAMAIGQAAMLIRGGLQDMVIAGGAQEISSSAMTVFDAIGAFSVRHAEPHAASRPFDAGRDGLVPSGGAACVILEALDHARARGAKVYGTVRGYGFSCDGSSFLSRPNGSGAVRAMTAALRDAQLAPQSVDYVNAHATSTPIGDQVEAQAIATVLGTSVPVSSTKSMTGHECWMSGASEVVYAALMARDGFIAPNINFGRRGDDMPPINIVTRALPHGPRIVMSNSFGFGGTNAVLVLDFGDATSPRS